MEENVNNQNEVTQINKEEKKAKPNKTGVVPNTEIDLGKIASEVSRKWRTSKWLTLQWKKESDFANEVVQYNTVLSSRLKDGSSRPQITIQLEQLNSKIDDSLVYVKNYITEKYKKTASKSYYAAFGFIHKNNAYSFPADQNSRLESLKRMIEGIEEHGFENKEYGLAFWKDCFSDFEKTVQKAMDKDGAVSVKVGDKKILKKEVKKALNAIVLVIKANYPDTYKEELRSWGFQKEKY